MERRQLNQLRTAFAKGDLTLYLGAGVSRDSGLPSWEELVLAMYFRTVESSRGLDRVFSNYLFAVAEWQLKTRREPLEITARKIRRHFDGTSADHFLEALHQTLYGRLMIDGKVPRRRRLLAANDTLRAVANLCRPTPKGGVGSVISYNYDSLLETSLGRRGHLPIFSGAEPKLRGRLPIYHVHGYVPLDRRMTSSERDGIIFTEDQYNSVASDPYAWSNLVQLHQMTSSTGLTIGLSLSDRSMRRLLDAIRRSPITTRIHAILRRSTWREPVDHELQDIEASAMANIDRFERSGSKRRPGSTDAAWQQDVQKIMTAVQGRAETQQEQVLRELGVDPIWIDDYGEIPGILDRIRA